MLSPGSLNMNGCRRRDDVGVGCRVTLAAHLLHAVDTGAEGLVARPGEHDAAHRIVAAQRAPQRVQLALHQRVERVVDRRTVQRDDGDSVSPSS